VPEKRQHRKGGRGVCLACLCSVPTTLQIGPTVYNHNKRRSEGYQLIFRKSNSKTLTSVCLREFCFVRVSGPEQNFTRRIERHPIYLSSEGCQVLALLLYPASVGSSDHGKTTNTMTTTADSRSLIKSNSPLRSFTTEGRQSLRKSINFGYFPITFVYIRHLLHRFTAFPVALVFVLGYS
jgi:hypothetical protein